MLCINGWMYEVTMQQWGWREPQICKGMLWSIASFERGVHPALVMWGFAGNFPAAGELLTTLTMLEGKSAEDRFSVSEEFPTLEWPLDNLTCSVLLTRLWHLQPSASTLELCTWWPRPGKHELAFFGNNVFCGSMKIFLTMPVSGSPLCFEGVAWKCFYPTINFNIITRWPMSYPLTLHIFINNNTSQFVTVALRVWESCFIVGLAKL